MKKSRRILAIVLALVSMVSVFSIVASASTYYYTSNSYKDYCTAKLNKPGKTNASVKVSVVSTKAASVKMTDGNGRHIWSETNAIKVGGVMPQGSRVFNLGKDHSVYRIYVKTPYAGTASFSNAKNCSIK